MKTIVPLLVVLLASPELSLGQVNQAQADDFSTLFDKLSCGSNLQPGKTVCEIVLPRLVDAKANKSGDHILLRTNLVTSSREAPITMLDAVIVEAKAEPNGDSVLRIRIDKGLREDGREIPIEARIVAVASASSVTEGWQFPPIIVDRFPRMPEDDERLPGEKKLSELPPHSSPVDSTPGILVHYKVVCLDKKTKASAKGCTNLLEARGVYGYNKLTLAPVDASSPTESVFSSKKKIALRAGTVLILEVNNIP